MSSKVSVRAPVGKVTVVKLKRTAKAGAATTKKQPPKPFANPRASVKTWAPIRARFEHLGVSLATTPRPGTRDLANDRINQWLTDTFEAGPFPLPHEVADYAEQMRARAQPPDSPIRYLYSGRELPGRGYPWGAVDLVSGWNASLRLRRQRQPEEQDDAPRPDGFWGVQHNAAYTHAMRSPLEVLADWDRYREQFESSPDPEAMGRWERRRRDLERLQQEEFDGDSARFAGHDMTLVAGGLPPGLYVPSFLAGDQFFGWDPLDTVNYKSELVAREGRARAISPPQLPTGRDQGTDVTIRAVPRRHEYLFSWTAVYLNLTLFSPPIVSVEVNVGAYADQLPMDFAYVSSDDDLRNSAAISRRIERSHRYAVAYLQDLGSEIYTPYYIKVLAARVDGQWALRKGDLNVGDPCAFLDVGRGDGSTDRYEITRRTYVVGGDRINYGILATEAVTPYDPSGAAIYEQSMPFPGL